MGKEGRRKKGNRNRECVLVRVPTLLPPISVFWRVSTTNPKQHLGKRRNHFEYAVHKKVKSQVCYFSSHSPASLNFIHRNPKWHVPVSSANPTVPLGIHSSIFFSNTDLWSANDSLFSALRVPAVANMIVVSRSAIIPDTALAAVIQACVPLFPAWRADKTKET